MSKVYEETGDQNQYDYIYDFSNRMIKEDGTIGTYKLSSYNLDMTFYGLPPLEAIKIRHEGLKEIEFK